MSPIKKILWRTRVLSRLDSCEFHRFGVSRLFATKEQERIVGEAVTRSNQHADEYLGALRGDLTKIEGGSKSGIGAEIGQTVNKSTQTLSDSIGKVGKPQPKLK